MYAGHFAAGLALKAAAPRTPTWAIATGVGLLDLLFGMMCVLGWERATDAGGLDIPWSHSLAMAILWAAAYAALFHRQGGKIMAVLALAVFSHWLLDVLVHARDMALWPGSSSRLGFKSIFGGNAGWFETLFVVLTVSAYAWAAIRTTRFGRVWPVACAAVGVCYALEVVAG